MTTFINRPVYHPTTTLAGYAKVISVHDKGLPHKIQLIFNCCCYFTVHRGMPKYILRQRNLSFKDI